MRQRGGNVPRARTEYAPSIMGTRRGTGQGTHEYPKRRAGQYGDKVRGFTQ